MKVWLKMKALNDGFVLWVATAVIGLLAAVSTNAEEPTLTPSDFYQGAELSTTVSAPFYRLAMPDRAYFETAWSDFRDVRVFNHTGQAMTYALVPVSSEKIERDERPLKVFPLRVATKKVAGNGTEGRVVLKSADGVEVTLHPGEQRAIGTTYLLKASDTQPLPKGKGFDQITLEWKNSSANWQAKVSVYGSSDLKNWRLRAADAPLMDLLSGGERLALNYLDLDSDGSSRHDRYWLLVSEDNQTSMPTIYKAQAVSVIKRSDTQTLEVPFGVKTVSNGEVIYQLDRAQPLSALSIVPAQSNAVLPVSVEYRSSADSSWQPLSNMVIYRLENADGDRVSTPLPLHKILVQSVRVRAINSNWGEEPPLVKGGRDRVEIIFNAQGNQPYLLTWGAKIAPSASIDIASLIPAAIAPKGGIDELHWAEVGPTVTLGGESRLTAESAAEATARWRTWLLWGSLIIGVVVLGLVTLKLVREATSKPVE